MINRNLKRAKNLFGNLLKLQRAIPTIKKINQLKNLSNIKWIKLFQKLFNNLESITANKTTIVIMKLTLTVQYLLQKEVYILFIKKNDFIIKNYQNYLSFFLSFPYQNCSLISIIYLIFLFTFL